MTLKAIGCYKSTSMITLNDLNYEYPEELVAQKPQSPPRVMWAEDGGAQELTFSEFLNRIPQGDLLVVNDTRVLKRRVFAGNLEILFLSSNDEKTEWDVLFPSKDLKVGAVLELPENVQATLVQKGRPQKLKTSKPLPETYFETCAELPLPPYIQKARGVRHNISEDPNWYQTAWAQKPGSLAAPTASLHFKTEDMQNLKDRGVEVEHLTLHVGLGTFLPLTPENFEKKQLHEEWIEISEATWEKILKAKKQGRKVWALGTTVTRSLEACAFGHLQNRDGKYLGTTSLFIQPGFEFQIIDRLLTNFHQPNSSLLALVMAFAGVDAVKKNYQWAIEQKFRLFSYGDFSAWIR